MLMTTHLWVALLIKVDIHYTFSTNYTYYIRYFLFTENEVAPIAGFLQSMYSEKKLYRVGYNSCRMDGGCKLFKYVSIKVYVYT